jgi:hypothetical protein
MEIVREVRFLGRKEKTLSVMSHLAAETILGSLMPQFRDRRKGGSKETLSSSFNPPDQEIKCAKLGGSARTPSGPSWPVLYNNVVTVLGRIGAKWSSRCWSAKEVRNLGRKGMQLLLSLVDIFRSNRSC